MLVAHAVFILSSGGLGQFLKEWFVLNKDGSTFSTVQQWESGKAQLGISTRGKNLSPLLTTTNDTYNYNQ